MEQTALRLTLVTGNAPGNDMRFYNERVEASRNFANKVWNASRFILMNMNENVVEKHDSTLLTAGGPLDLITGIVEEHGVLPYPEGTACAEVLLAGEEGGDKSKVVFAGLGIAAVYKFIADGLSLFPSEVNFDIQNETYTCGIGMDVLPALAGVGLHLWP